MTSSEGLEFDQASSSSRSSYLELLCEHKQMQSRCSAFCFVQLGGPVVEPCADVIVSAAARRSISVGGGGAPPVQKIGGGAAWAAKNIFLRFPNKISFYIQNFLMTLFSHSFIHSLQAFRLHSAYSREILRGAFNPSTTK